MAGKQASGPVADDGAREDVAAIRARLGELLGEEPAGEITRLSSGASRATYLLASDSHGELVLQIDRRGKPSGDAPVQAALLRAAIQAGVPVPRVLAQGSDDEVLGASWTLVEAIAGSTDPKQIIEAADAADTDALIDSVAQVLACVHRMPAAAELAPAVDDPLAQLRNLYDQLGEPHPTFELAFRALGPDRAPARRTLVHGDFRMGNLMVDANRVTGVLDWELAHIGDPIEDLGWLCVPAWRFTRQDLPVAGIATREQLLAAYERHSCLEVDEASLRRWELAGTLRWGVICVMQAFTHLSGAIRSVEHAVIGRRACEVEWDLLELLDPRPAGGPVPASLSMDPPAPLRPRLHDRPTTVELLQAARGALGEDVLPLLQGRAAFELRVSMRALGIVRRELEHAAEHAALHSAALCRLGVADERELASAIRGGAFAGREQECFGVLRAVVRAKLEVANPAYLRVSADTPAKEET